MNRNRLISSWENPHANIAFTYCSHSLNHFSVIDHFIVSSNIYDSITANHVLCDLTNISLHNAISLSMSSFGCQPIISVNPSMHTSKRCNWKKATKAQCTLYSEDLNDALTIIDLSSPFLKCKYLSCTDCDHINAIDNASDTVVKCCIDSGLTNIPSSDNNVREVPGWNDEVKQAKDQSIFWHWIWLESGRPNTGHVYAIMKRTRHQYHYSVRRCKLKKTRNTENKTG